MTATTVLGIDIGGSGVKGAPVELPAGRPAQDRIRIPTPSPASPEALTATVAELVRRLGWSGPIGCTFPGVVVDGRVFTATNLDPAWVGVAADRLLTAATGCPVTVMNDADAAGVAEVGVGAAADHTGTVLVLTLGTGIGSALFRGGRLVPNTELGQLPVRGRPGELRAAARVREERGLSWRRYAGLVNEFLALVETVLWPDLIVIGGGVSSDAAEWFHLLRTRAELVPARLANRAGIVGAAMWAAAPADAPVAAPAPPPGPPAPGGDRGPASADPTAPPWPP